MTKSTKKTAIVSAAFVVFGIMAFILGSIYSGKTKEEGKSFKPIELNNVDYASNLKALDELLASLDKPLVVKTSSDFYRVGDEIFYCVDINESVPKDVADEISKRFLLLYDGYLPLGLDVLISVNGKIVGFEEYYELSPTFSLPKVDGMRSDDFYQLRIRNPFPIYGRIRASDVAYTLKYRNRPGAKKEFMIPNLGNTVEFKLILATGRLKNCSIESSSLTLDGLYKPGAEQCARVRTNLNGSVFYDGEPYSECVKAQIIGDEERFLQEIDKLVAEGDNSDDPFKRGYYLQTAEERLSFWLRGHEMKVWNKREEVRKKIGLLQ